MPHTINWRSLFDRLGIQYVERSSNISAGEIGVKCPWCGAADPSEHMAVDEGGRGYVCRRNRAHRGKSPARLIAKIKRIPYEAAEGLIGRRSNTPSYSQGTISQFKKFMQRGDDADVDLPPLKYWPEFRRVKRERGMAMIFWNYLRNRGFSPDEIQWLQRFYDLHYASHGRFAYRLIIPIYDYNGRLVNWVGRAVGADQKPRYRALPEDQASPPGSNLLGVHKLLHYGGVALIVMEGPTDAFRVSAVGHKYGIYGTCLFGLNVSPEQAELLRELGEVFEQVYLALDPDARMRVMGMMVRAGMRIPHMDIPPGSEDPGEMTTEQTEDWLAPIIEEELHYGEERGERPVIG